MMFCFALHPKAQPAAKQVSCGFPHTLYLARRHLR